MGLGVSWGLAPTHTPQWPGTHGPSARCTRGTALPVPARPPPPPTAALHLGASALDTGMQGRRLSLQVPQGRCQHHTHLALTGQDGSAHPRPRGLCWAEATAPRCP